MNREELKNILPHREPMLLVDEAYLNEDGTATGYYQVRGDEFFLQGHFPGNPIVPGVIQCEMMAQSACIMFEEMMNKKGCIPVYTGLDKVRFRNMVKPGDRVRIDTKLIRSFHPMYVLHGELTVDGKKCMSGDFSFAITGEGDSKEA
ncbi:MULTISPECIES: 3-hydroxyacyl-ACP dehydratase FabZ [unclassified Butyrivibrio]|uniref:3-hydroxyacyl-ACP dehydratase FabZ n=1 Tax=unclassified Butyrivibrio TaxID=2639466 RepID=UPI0008EC7D20|nr:MULTISPECIES: 3-hydroxyacyl-ACP dehydratase FabZ [unclassified Butyrivibrio]RKM53993.1 beta-hydroxyacyl-ACP dehydratase [Butyrivibrio sp. X503]RKM56066.1 beta-hydroxyacyl-ACP dehydratase [Butyrivibrio sp. XB500-5]SFU94522.1 3-hydroxyacyl-[acyl-carrier-protein] dehydratase [Butyrivibrio sp. INlla21]